LIIGSKIAFRSLKNGSFLQPQVSKLLMNQ
jgi:hypothetical protein